VKVVSRRRSLVSLILSAMLFALCSSAEAQQTTKIPRIAYLGALRLEVIKDAVPKLARVGLLWTPPLGQDPQLKEIRPAALALKLKLEEIETPPDVQGLESAFQTAKQKQVSAIMTTATRAFFAERRRIVELATKYRLPAITQRRSLSTRAA
jgi:ABC-type uncharacterized transport system substrate-binding protein